MARYRIRPSKSVSVMGMVIGIIFIGLGVFLAIPLFGAFGIFWTVVAGVITAFHAINVFSSSGIGGTEIVSDVDPEPKAEPLPFDERLRRLEQLRQDGLITEEEFQRKRAEFLNERW